MPLSRRQLIKRGIHATLAASVLPVVTVGATQTDEIKAKPSYSPLNKWPGRCAYNYNRNATNEKGDAQKEIIVSMVNESIVQLTGEQNVGDAWKAVFPDTLSTKSKIAIKINILNYKYPPHPFVVVGIVDGLQQMKFNGKSFPASSIYIYDSNNNNSFERAGYLAEYFPGVNMIHHGSKQTNFGDGAHSNTAYAETLHQCDFLINVPGLRGHNSYAGKVTLGFKSHYGTYPPLYHDHKTQAYISEINCTGPVFNKTVLTVCAAIFGLSEGHGPLGLADNYLTYAQTIDPDTTNKAPNTILMSTDPVTTEFQAIRIMRIRDKKEYTLETMPQYLLASSGVEGIFKKTYNIGIIEEKKMDMRKIVNGKKV